MDQSTVEAYLTRIRAAGDAELRPCGLVTPEVQQGPALRVGVAHLFLRPRFLLADPTGTGKTPHACVAYGYLREKDPSLKLLVVTTKSAQYQWASSVHRFLHATPAIVLGFDIHKIRVSPQARRGNYHTLLGIPVWVTTYETLAQDQDILLPLLENYVVVFDEVQKVNNFKTAAAAAKADDGRITLYGAAARFASKSRVSWALSATPMRNDRLDELYSVMELIRPGTFGPYPQFRRTYYILKLVKPRWKLKGGGQPKSFYENIGLQNQEQLRTIIDPFYLRRPDSAFNASRPPVTYRYEDIFLSPQQQKVYDQVWAGSWPQTVATNVMTRPGVATNVMTRPGVATNVMTTVATKRHDKLQRLTAVLRAQQVLAVPELMGFKNTGNAKWDRLLELLKGDFQDTKTLIYTKFSTVANWLSLQLTAAKIGHGLITGDTPAGAREGARQRFQASEQVRVMVLTDAGGEALDLQAASVVLFYDLPWSHGNFQQVVGRARRVGSAHDNILTVPLVAVNSIDSIILQVLTRKEKAIRATLIQGNSTSDNLLSSANSNSNSNSNSHDSDSDSDSDSDTDTDLLSSCADSDMDFLFQSLEDA